MNNKQDVFTDLIEIEEDLIIMRDENKTTKVSLWKRIQRGFTLLEMAAVVAAIGIVIGIIAPWVIGSGDNARAVKILSFVEKGSSQWQLVTQSIGVPSSVSNNPLYGTGVTSPLDILGTGVSKVATSYQGAFSSAKVLPLDSNLTLNGTDWQVESFTVTVTGGGASPLVWKFQNVPKSTALFIFKQKKPDVKDSDLVDGFTVGPWKMTGSGDPVTLEVTRNI